MPKFIALYFGSLFPFMLGCLFVKNIIVARVMFGFVVSIMLIWCGISFLALMPSANYDPTYLLKGVCGF